ncbi:MAG: response regulator [Chloroflexi bacterium]|nr:response regulator [Chloroflexota bacterium]
MLDNQDLIATSVLYDNLAVKENLAPLKKLIEAASYPMLDFAPPPPIITPVSNGGGHILLAEDNEFTAETMSDYLHFHGFHVNLARNGYEVIDQALFLKPNLIIMDIQMPELNGFDAMLRLRAESATVTTPIIALTALAMVGDRERCLAAGANAYFSKPLSLRQLINTIQTFLFC